MGYLFRMEDKIYSLGQEDITLKEVCELNNLTTSTFEEHGISKEILSSNLKGLLSKREYRKIKILNTTLEREEESIVIGGLSVGHTIETKEGADLTPEYINYISDAIFSATKDEKDVLKFIFSSDGGKTWKTFKEGAWTPIFKSDVEIAENGITIEELNGMTEEQLKSLGGKGEVVKLAFHTKKNNYETEFFIDRIELKYNTSLEEKEEEEK